VRARPRAQGRSPRAPRPLWTKVADPSATWASASVHVGLRVPPLVASLRPPAHAPLRHRRGRRSKRCARTTSTTRACPTTPLRWCSPRSTSHRPQRACSPHAGAFVWWFRVRVRVHQSPRASSDPARRWWSKSRPCWPSCARPLQSRTAWAWAPWRPDPTRPIGRQPRTNERNPGPNHGGVSPLHSTGVREVLPRRGPGGGAGGAAAPGRQPVEKSVSF